MCGKLFTIVKLAHFEDPTQPCASDTQGHLMLTSIPTPNSFANEYLSILSSLSQGANRRDRLKLAARFENDEVKQQ